MVYSLCRPFTLRFAAQKGMGGFCSMKVREEVTQKFGRWMKLSDLAEDTIEAYCRTVRAFCDGKDIKSINNLNFFLSTKETLKSNGRSLNTISRHVFALKKFLIFLSEEYKIS